MTSSSITSSSTTTSASEQDLQKSIVKDLHGLSDTIAKFQDDLDNLIQDEEKVQEVKIFREEVEHFKSTTRRPGKICLWRALLFY